MPNTNTGYGRGIGRIQESGAPSGGNRSSDAIKALAPHNTRPISLRPGMVVVGTSHFYSGANLGAIPLSGNPLSSPGEPARFVGTPATWTQGDAAMFNGNGYLITDPVSGGGSTVISQTISSASIKTLDTVPVTIVGAPGAGKMVIVDWDLYLLNFNSIGYTVGGGIGLFYNFINAVTTPYVPADAFGASLDPAVIAAVNNASAYNLGVTGSANDIGNGTLANYANQSVLLGASDTITTGNSTLTLIVAYHIEDLP